MKTNQENLINTLNANINVKNRPNDLMTIGETLNQLIELSNGNKKEVAKNLGLSIDMVNKFLSVFKVSPPIQKLIKERKVDTIFAVHSLKSFSPKDQAIVAAEIVNKKFNSQEARALVPLRNTFPDEPIKRLVDVIRNTKDSKYYVNHFPYPDKKGVEIIRMRIQNVVGDEEFSLTPDSNIGIFKITKSGNKKMRADAAQQKMGFHNYLLKIFNPSGKGMMS